LFYARLQKISWYEVHDGIRYGYWDFCTSWLMRNIFPWLLLVDTFLAACWMIYLPLALGRTVVCERFVLDMLVDLSLAYKTSQFINSLTGLWLIRLIPAHCKVVVLDLEADLVRERRKDLVWDHRLGEKLNTFCFLAAEKGIPVILNQSSKDDVFLKILSLFGLEHVSE
jgi:hypothetical protein